MSAEPIDDAGAVASEVFGSPSAGESSLYFSAMGGPVSSRNSVLSCGHNRNTSNIFEVHDDGPDWGHSSSGSSPDAEEYDGQHTIEASAAHFADADSRIMHSALDQSIALFCPAGVPQRSASLLADEECLRASFVGPDTGDFHRFTASSPAKASEGTMLDEATRFQKGVKADQEVWHKQVMAQSNEKSFVTAVCSNDAGDSAGEGAAEEWHPEKKRAAMAHGQGKETFFDDQEYDENEHASGDGWDENLTVVDEGFPLLSSVSYLHASPMEKLHAGQERREEQAKMDRERESSEKWQKGQKDMKERKVQREKQRKLEERERQAEDARQKALEKERIAYEALDERKRQIERQKASTKEKILTEELERLVQIEEEEQSALKVEKLEKQQAAHEEEEKEPDSMAKEDLERENSEEVWLGKEIAIESERERFKQRADDSVMDVKREKVRQQEESMQELQLLQETEEEDRVKREKKEMEGKEQTSQAKAGTLVVEEEDDKAMSFERQREEQEQKEIRMSPLHEAAKNGDARAVHDILQSQGKKVDVPGWQGMSPLHFAAQGGSKEVTSLLIRLRANCNVRDDNWFCAIHHAADRGHAGVIESLLREGLVDIESECRGGRTALHMAVEKGHQDAVTTLLLNANVSEIDHQDSEGRTALHYACDANFKAPMVRGLIEAGADPHVENSEGKTPIAIAREGGHADILRELTPAAYKRLSAGRAAGSAPPAAVASLVSSYPSASLYGQSPGMEVHARMSPPFGAAAKAAIPADVAVRVSTLEVPSKISPPAGAAAKATLPADADVRVSTHLEVGMQSGRQSQSTAAGSKVSTMETDTPDSSESSNLARGDSKLGDVSYCPRSTTQIGGAASGLHFAAMNGDAAGLRAILSEGGIRADPNAGDAEGKTPLHFSALSEGPQAAVAASLLIRSRADTALRDNTWHCSLHYAAQTGNAAVISVLVEEGQADLESECKGGRTALHMAAQHGHDDAVKALLKHSHPDLVNHQDQEGRTALHYACDAEEKVRIVSALVEAGGDPNMSDFSGRTPIDDAREGSRGGLLSILERGPRRVSECGVGEGGVGRFSCEEDTITLRGEVWVARRLMPVPETLPDTHSDQGGQGAPVWGLQTVVLPPAPAGARPGKGSQDGAFATWGATHLGGRQVRAGVPQNLLASVDLTRSVVDDWIVVDEDDDLFRRDAAARSSQRELPLGVGASAVEVMSGAVSEVRKNIRWALDSSLSKATMMWPFTGSSREGADGVRK